jgi:putative acetyltransferase
MRCTRSLQVPLRLRSKSAGSRRRGSSGHFSSPLGPWHGGARDRAPRRARERGPGDQGRVDHRGDCRSEARDARVTADAGVQRSWPAVAWSVQRLRSHGCRAGGLHAERVARTGQGGGGAARAEPALSRAGRHGFSAVDLREVMQNAGGCRRDLFAGRSIIETRHRIVVRQTANVSEELMDPVARSVNVDRGSPRHPEVVRMIADLDAYVAELYPAESNHLLDIEALCTPDLRFFVARLDGEVVGCGALRLDPAGYGELKRMFVGRHARGKKVGRAVLARLEQEASDAKLSCLRLETGTLQAEALGLYRSAGYREIQPFGAYRPDPLSVFMEKRLGNAGEHGVAATGASPRR